LVLLEAVRFVCAVVFSFRSYWWFFLTFCDFRQVRFCTAECRACWEALATGVKESVVNNKAQSVIEILFIRATGQSLVNAGHQSYLRVIFKTRRF
jgi:hypothetical protein